MRTYTVTLTSESTGEITSETITAADARAAVSGAYLARYDVIPGRDSIRPRGMNISDREFIVIGTAGAVTLADVESVPTSTYTVTRVGRIGKPLTGAPVRKYQAADARTAGALYVAADGIDGAQYAGGDASLFKFNPPADGAPVRVRVQVIEDTVHYRKVWRCTQDSGSMYAKRDAGGFVEVFASDLDRERAAGTHLFRITA